MYGERRTVDREVLQAGAGRSGVQVQLGKLADKEGR